MNDVVMTSCNADDVAYIMQQQLTPREVLVISMYREGYLFKEIGEALCLSTERARQIAMQLFDKCKRRLKKERRLIMTNREVLEYFKGDDGHQCVEMAIGKGLIKRPITPSDYSI